MEEFLNIDWHPPLEDIIDDVFINEERMKKESAMYRIMQGTFTDPFTDFESDDSQDDEEDAEEDNETNNTAKKAVQKTRPLIPKTMGYVPGIIKASFKFPRVSNLSKEQHATCLRVLLRFSQRDKPEIDPKSRKEVDLYMKLCPAIREEQEEFLDLAKANWDGSRLKILEDNYINERWRSKVERLKKLPRYYIAGGNVPFNGEEKINVTVEATLLEMGQLPRVIVPSGNKKRNTIYCNINKLELLYPATEDFTTKKTTVSQDPNCERLAHHGEVDLVISSGGLNCLANNFGPNYTSSWILPIVVKENEKGNVIYVDKPLPPTAMTVPQQNAWIYKYILKSQLLHPAHPTSISLSDHENEDSTNRGPFGDPNSADLLKLEEEHEQSEIYGVKKKSEQSRRDDATDSGDLAASETKNEVDSFENDLQISQELSNTPIDVDHSDSTIEKNFEPKQVTIQSVGSDCTVSSPNTRTNTNDAEDIIDKDILMDRIPGTESHGCRDSTETNLSPACPRERSNVTYKIFSLESSGNIKDDSMKTKVENYRILVRTKIDGIERIDKETLHPVMLVPKLEHQVALGAEAVTAEEAFKQWTILTYRPDTSLVRIRISADNSEVIQIERRTAMSINNEIKRLYNLNVEDSPVILHNVIHHFKALKPGNYLLRHTPTNGAFATIYQEADSSGKNVFDLHATYAQNCLKTIANVPWPAIDRLVVTPSQICFERMPAMYHPPRIDTDIKSKVTRGRGRGGSQGRGRGLSFGAARGGLQEFGRGGPRGGLTGKPRVRTKKAKKKNKAAKTQAKQS